MRALPIIIVVLLLSGIAYLLRNSVSGLFTGTTASNDSQTVVLRQSATPTPTATPVATATPTPVSQTSSIVTMTSTPSPIAANLPTAGPADGLVTAGVIAAVLVLLYRLVAPKPVVKAKIDIL